MPMFELTCNECGNEFDSFCKFEELAAELCPACGGQAEQAFRTPASVHFGSSFRAGQAPKNIEVEVEMADGSKTRKNITRQVNLTESKVPDADKSLIERR